jgi:pseudouridine-5'-phosphate glycosidase
VLAANEAFGLDDCALVLANPLPPEEQLDPELHARVLSEGLAAAEAEARRGAATSPPFLLAHFHEDEGKSLEANIRLVLRNARPGREIAARRPAAA